jgi:hypothetical protein
MLTRNDILFGVVLPFVLSGALLKVPRLLRCWGYWTGPLAVGVAFTAGFGCIEGSAHLFPFPPRSAIPWLFYLGLFFTLVGLLDAGVKIPKWVRPIIVFVAMGAGAGVLLRFQFVNHVWDAMQGSAWLMGIAGVGVVWWWCFESAAGEGGIVLPLGAMFITGIGGLVVMLVADQTVGQALGAMAVALAAAAAVVGWFGDVSLVRGTAVVVAGMGACALAAAYFVSDVPIVDLSLVAIAPLLLAGGIWLPMGNLRPWLRISIRLVIVLVPLGIALGLAVAQFQREALEKSSDPYSMEPHMSSRMFSLAALAAKPQAGDSDRNSN